MTYHVPVLLEASVEALGVKPGGVYFDLTFGGGGHSREILRRLGPSGRLVAFDRDADAASNVPADDARFTFVASDYRYVAQWARFLGVEKADGILADLGVSSHHLDDASRGFSFRFDAPLDMRMNQRGGQTAADVLNGYDAGQLATVFRLYGELQGAHRLADAVVQARAKAPLLTVGQLTEAVEPLLPRLRVKKEMAKVFQALRIEVNAEMESLRRMLEAAAHVLKPGGRLVVLTYHSLEDRMVKNVMRSGNVAGSVEQDFFGRVRAPFRTAGGKPIVPDVAEQETNPRSRSAKLRVAERVADEAN
ncbi:MAG: 16S rRNA (cytosine(1402)-N(4))-methyltransferase RsmH [Bacteroidaceae bacterium]|nr:16S rRNA (cytosine(1402)-N(4))-methyltransferase RsmH [Bacteroidaceae bacterium]